MTRPDSTTASALRGPLAALLVAAAVVVLTLLGSVAPASAQTAPAPTTPTAPAAVPDVPVVRDVPPVPDVQDRVAARPPAAGTRTGSTTTTPGFLPDVRDGAGGATSPIALVLLLGSLSVLPGVLIMTTAFTRVVIVLGFVRSALGTQGVPPNQVLIGLALFVTFFIMGPVFSEANEQALQPFLEGRITQGQAFDRGLEPFRGFMLDNVREKDLALFVELSGEGPYAAPTDTPTTTLVPAYVISELRAAFLIGFVVFVPFIVIDLVVSAALSAMGMAMLPPSMISLPFKLLLFVAVDGWFLLVSSLVRSFNV